MRDNDDNNDEFRIYEVILNDTVREVARRSFRGNEIDRAKEYLKKAMEEGYIVHVMITEIIDGKMFLNT